MATSPLPLRVVTQSRELPDYVPARMVNEFVYCPRLFYYMWVESVFLESADTIEGSAQHSRVDKQTKGLPKAEDAPLDEVIHSPPNCRASASA